MSGPINPLEILQFIQGAESQKDVGSVVRGYGDQKRTEVLDMKVNTLRDLKNEMVEDEDYDQWPEEAKAGYSEAIKAVTDSMKTHNKR